MIAKHKLPCCAPSTCEANVGLFGTYSSVASAHPVEQFFINLNNPEFLMGDENAEGYPGDGEGPQRHVRCASFCIAPCTVTNSEFDRFVKDSGYITTAEKFGWSFVFYNFVPENIRFGLKSPADTPWWLQVRGACWAAPEGPGSDINARMGYPVTHVSWYDAQAYCHWSETRLPSEAEWECAARGGLEGKRYAWGDILEPKGNHQCNIWQGSFPDCNTAEDGYIATAPANSFKPNQFGLYNVCGNVWEWCEDWFSPNYHRVTRAQDPIYLIPTGNRSMRGGSFLCHRSYCNRYRVAARSSNTPESSTSHCGFRVVSNI